MDTNLEHALTRLAKGSVLRIEEGAGQAVAVFSGLVWITQDADPRDMLISEGESFTLDRPGLAIVQALSDSRVLLIGRSELPGGAERAGPARPSAYELHAVARELHAQALGDAVRRLAALPRLLWRRMAAHDAA